MADETPPTRKKTRRKATPATPAKGSPSQTHTADGGDGRVDNVVGLFPDAVGPADRGKDRGGMVPEGGASAADGDERVRVRIRAGKRWSEIINGVKTGEFTWEEFVSALSPTELARGQLKDKNGNFSGRPPAMVPRAFHDACIRELMKRGQTAYRENYLVAIQAMTSIAQNPMAKESDRIKAAQFVIERLEGKVPERLEIAAADPWQTIIGGIVADVEDTQIANAQAYLERM